MWRVFVAFDSVCLCHRVVDFAGFQNLVEVLPVFFNVHLIAAFAAEYRAGDLVCGQSVDDWLNLRADGHQPILSSLSLCAASEGAVLPVIVAGIQIQKFSQ